MSTTPVSPAVTEPCPSCAAPLASDQRYCLECGEPRTGARRPMPAALRRSAVPEPASVAAARPLGGSLAAWLAGLACLLLAVGVGVLIGRSGERTAAAPITISGAAAGASSSDGATPSAAAPVSFRSDWPAGRSGWTVALQALPKDGSDAAAVASAKTAAGGRGAADVGALDSDAYRSLTAGSYVVYSGVFGSRAAATAARTRLAKTFPDARVVQVSDSAAATGAGPAPAKPKPKPKTEKSAGAGTSAGAGSGGGNAFEKSKKLPKKLGTGGKPPPKDNKPAAGGSGFEEIK